MVAVVAVMVKVMVGLLSIGVIVLVVTSLSIVVSVVVAVSNATLLVRIEFSFLQTDTQWLEGFLDSSRPTAMAHHCAIPFLHRPLRLNDQHLRFADVCHFCAVCLLSCLSCSCLNHPHPVTIFLIQIFLNYSLLSVHCCLPCVVRAKDCF